MKLNKNYCTCWFRGTWNQCCKKHDECYEKAFIRRLFCDRKFKICVHKKGKAGKLFANIMYRFVRLFGESHYTKKQIMSKRILNEQNT